MPNWTLYSQTKVWVWVILVNPLTKRLLEDLWGFFARRAIKEHNNPPQENIRRDIICLSVFVFVIGRCICLQLDSSDLVWISETALFLISRMSPTQFKKYIFLTSFAEKNIHLSNKHESHPQNQFHTAWDPNKPRQPDIEMTSAFGVQDGLLSLMERVFSLHTLARETGNLDSESIPQALAIWNDLEHLNPPETLDSSDSLSLHASCVSALFVWLYLVVHPEDMEEEKVQNTVYTGLVNAENISDVEFHPFLLIPAFCLGLASIRKEDRDSVRGIFDKAERSGISKRFRETVNESWKRRDSGVKRSWDWGG